MPEPVPYRLPDLGEGMAEAEIVQWTVGVGAHVHRDQIVVHVQTDKAEVELPVPEAGTITALGGEVGDVLAVGSTLLEFIPDGAGASVPSDATPVPGATSVQASPPMQASPPIQASPPVRKLARESGVDLGRVTGSGPLGRVTAADVRAAAREDPADASAPRAGAGPVHLDADGSRREPLRGIRRAMAHNMAAAWREVPHVSLFDEIDARPVLAARRAARDLAGDDSITLTALFARAVVVALGELPILNAAFDGDADEIHHHDSCHLGVAVASPQGLVVPVVRDAQSKSLLELGADVAHLTAAARAGGLPPDVLADATFTLSNYGTEGGRFATPLVRPPQVGIFGCGAIRVRPVVDGAEVVAAPALPLALSVDHRVIDGRDATAFLERMVDLLLEPLPLLVDPH